MAKVSRASDCLSSVLRSSGVCRCPFLVVEVGVAVRQGAVDNNPDSRHSTQLQLGLLALGLRFGSGSTMNALTARSRNDVHHLAHRLCHCLVGCVFLCVASARVKGQVAWLPEQLRGNSLRARCTVAHWRRRSS